MDGRICFSLVQLLKDFSTKDISSLLEQYGYRESKENGFPTMQDFYKMSKINTENHYETCMLMSIKTSNNQEIIDRMEYNKFLILAKNLNKYIEAENNANGGEGGQKEEINNEMDSMKAKSQSMMSGMKNNFKMPSTKFK